MRREDGEGEGGGGAGRGSSKPSEDRTGDQLISKEESAHAGELTGNDNKLEEEFLQDCRGVFAF